MLRYLQRIGVTLSNNPFVYEMCTGTHAIERESHSFYDEWESGVPAKQRFIYHDRMQAGFEEGLKGSDSQNFLHLELDILGQPCFSDEDEKLHTDNAESVDQWPDESTAMSMTQQSFSGM
jgi:hypothetical protein